LTGIQDKGSTFREFKAIQWPVILEALTLPERIELFRKQPSAFKQNPERASARMEKWKDALGIPADGSMAIRLDSLGITAEEANCILGTLDPAGLQGIEAPSWWKICDQLIQQCQGLEPGTLPTCDFLTGEGPPPEQDDASSTPDPEHQIPHEHALSPWVEVATTMLSRSLPGIIDLLGPEVLRREQRGLLENLCMLARSTMEHRHQLEKLHRYTGNDLMLGLFSSTPPRHAYIAAVQSVLEDGWVGLLHSSPALARLLATRVECWVRTLAEFARHLEEDRPDLERVFNDGQPLGRIIKGGRGISDSHNGGRAVMTCRFECGTRIVYKPRSMSIDVAWIDIVKTFNANVEPNLQLKTLAVLDRDLHGWMEFAERMPCRSKEEVACYYRRMGCLLALIHTLQGNDFHLENVVASGAHPVAIDLETISVPEPIKADEGIKVDPAVDIVQRSVLRTLLLPSVMGMRGQNGVQNLGAVGIEVDAGKGIKLQKKLVRVNTDFQKWVAMSNDDPALHKNEQSRVELEDGTIVNGSAYQEEVERGYTQGYTSILKHRTTWLSEDGPIQSMGDAWVRVLNRSTNIYYRLLLETCSARLLESGVDRWIHGERFLVLTQGEAPVDSEAYEISNALAETEQAALLHGDIAYFIARADGTEYFSPDYITGSPIHVTGARLKASAVESASIQAGAMNEKDLKQQLFVMQSSYVAAYISMSNMHSVSAPTSTDEPGTDQPPHTPTHSELDTWIIRTLERIESMGIMQEDQVNWLDFSIEPQSETVRPNALGTDIYSGRGGMSMLFERAYRHFSDPRWLTLARKCVHNEFTRATRALHDGRFAGMDSEGPAGLMQRAGLIASCWTIGRHDGQGAYRELARKLLIDLNEQTIERDTGYDIISGSAGYMLLAMHLEREEPVPGLEPLLVALGEHLQKHTTDIDGTGWNSIGGRPLNGFGHGRAGIGLALLEAGTRLDRSDFRELGMDTFRAEHAMRSSEAGHGWPDLRSVDVGAPIPTGPQMNAWCAGAEGISLSRAAALSYSDDPILHDDLAYAIACMQEGVTTERSHLCCGQAGRAEAFGTIQRLLGTSLDQDRVLSLAHCIDTNEADPTSPDTGTLGLGLFQGTAGRVWSALSEVMDDDGSALTLLRF
jgi:type 2 lantibiotic biosynthesis protein LanM